MPYTAQIWHDAPATDTPINAARLTNMENGIVEGARQASTSVTGNVELATQTEMNTGTDTARVPSVSVVATYIGVKVAVLNLADATPSSGPPTVYFRKTT